MATVRAVVEMAGEKCVLKIDPGDDEIIIPISEDDANQVKRAFNQLLLRLRETDLRIKMENLGSDLFSQVAKEYVNQLNREIREIRGEMEQYGLTRA